MPCTRLEIVCKKVRVLMKQKNWFIALIFLSLFQSVHSFDDFDLVGFDGECLPDGTGIKEAVSAVDVLIDAVSAFEANVCSCIETTTVFSACNAEPITTATTISNSGTYCIDDTISGNITITASNVMLDLNGYTIQGSITIASNAQRVTIANGSVDAQGAMDGIAVASGTSLITLDHVRIKNAIRGLSFTQSHENQVRNCTFTQNTTGFFLDNATEISVRESTALENVHAGFDLISSSTNCFIECKAISTGFTNQEVTNNTVAGFISSDGYGNIFERCVANATQALSTTDLASVVAGFALRGSEECTKIIDSESANAIASSEGFTIPYGMVLELTTTQNVIKNNLVYCNQHDVMGTTTGIGISGSSSSNFIIGNIAYNNAQNYEFVTNVFNPLFQNAPSDLQNISLDGCEAIAMPQDQALTAQQIIHKIKNISQTTTSLIEEIVNKIDQLDACDATAVTNANTTISQEGRYCVAEPITGTIAINASNVELDLNGYEIGGGVTIGFPTPVSEVKVVNGTVLPSMDNSGLFVSNSHNVLLKNILATGGGGTGFFIELSHNVRVTNCRSTNNEVGLRATDSYNVNVSDTIASNNSRIGFELASSYTNCFIECKALSTGFENSTVFNVQVFGFVSNNGSSNIFERCIANATQALSATDSNSLIAGFALRGTEKCSKIIDSESANTKASTDGVTVPYGMVFESTTTQNIIKNNLVYCNQHDVMGTATGIGISDASSCNLVIGNIAYNNAQNYEFVTNVFDPSIQNAPSALQNISLDGCDPIAMPLDQVLIAKQIRYKLCSVESALEEIISFSFSDIVAQATLCLPTNITSAQTISTSGTYRCCQNITGDITIAASDVVLDLNKYKITGGIIVNNNLDQITLRNGVVENGSSGDGILVNSGATNITIENITVKNTTRGIHFDTVFNGLIDQVTLVENTTGLQLENSYNISVFDATAKSNLQAGYELLNSTTCCILDSKALSTGLNNTELFGDESNVFGFVLNDSYGNIIERCIANATQNLSATSYDTVVAGFALLGTGTQCNKIIGCEAANATASDDGFTVPYGIFLQAIFSGLQTVTTANPGIVVLTTESVTAVNWSPDGKYLAVGTSSGDTNDDLYVFSFDRTTPALIELASASPGSQGTNTVRTVNWSPDGQYIAVGTNNNTSTNDLFVYRFDRISNALTEIISINPGSSGLGDLVHYVDWSADSKYLAVGTSSQTTENDLYIYIFDRVAETLTQVASANPGSGTSTGKQVLWVNWSPDQLYLAVGVQINAAGGADNLFIYRFDRSTNTLTSLASDNPSGSTNVNHQVNSVTWTPNGRYLAVGDRPETSSTILFIYSFDPATNNLVKLAQVIPTTISATQQRIECLNWSPDGRYLALGVISNTSEEDLYVYSYDPATNSLTLLAKESPGSSMSTTVNVRSVNWSPDGQYLAVAVTNAGNAEDDLFIYTGLQFPSHNIIANNTLYCNSHVVMAPTVGTNLTGAGISGSSIANCIIQNNSYNNPFNYVFVTNEFNQLFGIGPNLVQNIGIDSCEVITTPQSLAKKMRRAELLLESLIDNLL